MGLSSGSSFTPQSATKKLPCVQKSSPCAVVESLWGCREREGNSDTLLPVARLAPPARPRSAHPPAAGRSARACLRSVRRPLLLEPAEVVPDSEQPSFWSPWRPTAQHLNIVEACLSLPAPPRPHRRRGSFPRLAAQSSAKPGGDLPPILRLQGTTALWQPPSSGARPPEKLSLLSLSAVFSIHSPKSGDRPLSPGCHSCHPEAWQPTRVTGVTGVTGR